MYRCTRCGQDKNEDQFPTRKDRLKRAVSFCFPCRRDYAREWYRKNLDKCRLSSRKSYRNNLQRNLDRTRKWRASNLQKIKEYSNRYYIEKTDQCRKKSREYGEKNREIRRNYSREWLNKNREYVKERSKSWATRNRAKIRMYYAKRQEHIRRATPPWADLKKIESIYQECDGITRETGIRHCVDHIIPLTHPLVCGLHVHNNLQILTHSENSKKHNKFNP